MQRLPIHLTPKTLLSSSFFCREISAAQSRHRSLGRCPQSVALRNLNGLDRTVSREGSQAISQVAYRQKSLSKMMPGGGNIPMLVLSTSSFFISIVRSPCDGSRVHELICGSRCLAVDSFSCLTRALIDSRVKAYAYCVPTMCTSLVSIPELVNVLVSRIIRQCFE
jgi:hypothetical protein